MNIEEKYKEEISEIRFRTDFEAETAMLMKKAVNKKGENNMFNKKPLKIILAAVLIIAVISVSAFAISNFLSARDVAEHLGESQVANSFDKQENEIESVTDKGYTVSFLGIVKGEKFKSNEIKSDCSYYVVSVASADGSLLSVADGNPLGMSVIIEGYPAWKINTWSLNTSASGMEENGVLYYLYDCENLEIFADKNVYLAVYEGFIPSLDIITMNPDGKFEFAESYNGFKAMFRIPLDTSKANPEAAYEILKDYLSEENTHFENQDVASHDTDETQVDLEYGVIESAEEGLGEDESAIEPMPNPKEKWTITN